VAGTALLAALAVVAPVDVGAPGLRSTPAASAAVDPPPFALSFGQSGSDDGDLYFPKDLAIDPTTGDVYVADTANQRVQVFSATGTPLRNWGDFGTAEGLFSAPVGIAVGPNGDVYVADKSNKRIQVFTSTGTFLRAFGNTGSYPELLSDPVSVAVGPTGTVYVSDYDGFRVVRYSSNGGFLGTFGSHGSSTGEFEWAWGLTIAPSGNLFVVDAGNRRIQEFTADGTFVRVVPTPGPGAGYLQWPEDLAIDDDGDIFVTDTTTEQVKRYASDGTFLVGWGEEGTGPGQFDNLAGLAVAPSGNVYVVDGFNHRVQVFGDLTAPAITLTVPADGGVYDHGTVVPAEFVCDDGAQGVGVATCAGTVGYGALIDVYTLGSHDFTVATTDLAGNAATVTHTYTVQDTSSPGITITSPAAGAVYPRDARVLADYSCFDEPGASGLASCVGTVPDGAAISTARNGRTTFSVTAVDAAGNPWTTTHAYTVATARPDARLKVGTKGALKGNDVYAKKATSAQTVRASVRAGRTATYTVSVQNDGVFSDRLRVTGQKSTSAFTVRYRNAAGKDITSAVVAGRYVTTRLAPKATTSITVKVTVGRNLDPGDTLRRAVTVSSTTHTSVRDVVALTTAVRR
jgi:DNA-binding beta-propeller fold protein YncE